MVNHIQDQALLNQNQVAPVIVNLVNRLFAGDTNLIECFCLERTGFDQGFDQTLRQTAH